MEIRLKLMGVLKGKTPAGDVVDLSAGATIANVLEALDISAESVHTFFVNGKVERDHGVVGREIADLSVPGAFVAGPPVDENHCLLASAGGRPVQIDAVNASARRDGGEEDARRKAEGCLYLH